MNTFKITRAELESIKCLPLRFRPDWPGAFSTNGIEIWLWRRWGNTPSKEREDVRGKSRVVDAVVAEYRLQRPEGGRFFVSNDGAFYCPEFLGIKMGNEQILAFDIHE